jgi:hypothetical protein
MSVSIRGGEPVQLSVPRPLFRLPRAPYDVSRDGRRFLTSSLMEDRPSIPIDIVIHWPLEIGQQAH